MSESNQMSESVIVRLAERPDLGPLVSPHRNQQIPIHNWFSYKHGYSSDLVSHLIKYFALPSGAWVLDPFCGGGTTLLTCRDLGLNALGVDILPFAVFLSNVKTSAYDAAELQQQAIAMKNADKRTFEQAKVTLPDIPLVRKAFQLDVRQTLLSLKSQIDDVPVPNVRSFFNLGFLSVLEAASNTSKNGGFLRIVSRDVSPDAIVDLFWRKIDSMIDDVKNRRPAPQPTKVTVTAKIGDARKLSTRRRFDCIITSPPYPNRHDYTRIYSLEMVFDFVSTNQELKKIRYETIRSHVEARRAYSADGYSQPTIVADIVAEVSRNGTNNPQVLRMITGYFEDMYLALRQMSRSLKNNGNIALVVSNVRFAGISIPVDEILSQIGLQAGLTPVEIWVARYRGNSSQQMREYQRSPSRESIIIWRKGS